LSIPKSVIKTKKGKNGQIEYSFTNNVDRVNYTLQELCKAALRDSGSLLLKRLKAVAPVRTGKLQKGLDKKVVKDKSTGAYVLKVGTRKKSAATEKKPYVPYIHLVLFGHTTKDGRHAPGNNFLERTTKESIDDIRKVQAQYLSAIEDEQTALDLISNNDKEEED